MTIPDYVERRTRQAPPGDCCVVPGSTPVISFGDVRTARVATVGINPSVAEFSGGHIPLGQRSVQEVLADCNGYFQREPFGGWFNQLEQILKTCGASYYDGSACALDLVQWATDPVWSGLPAPRSRRQKRLLERDAPFLKKQLEENRNIKLVLANGIRVVDELRALSFPLTPVGSIEPDGRNVRMFCGKDPRERVFVGWSQNLQSGHLASVMKKTLATAVCRLAAEARLYGNFKPCETLTPSEKCVRLQAYSKGRVEERFHRHVPAHRLAAKRIAGMLTTLVARYENAPADRIVSAHLTRRGRAARLAYPYDITVEYPEPGVFRQYCGGDILAWVDSVSDPQRFRRDSNHLWSSLPTR